MKRFGVFFFLTSVLAFSFASTRCLGAGSAADGTSLFKVGLEVLRDQDFKPLRGKKAGLIVNHSALTREGSHAADMLAKVGIAVKLFAPEHGIRGTKDEFLNNNEIDSATGLTVVSLYTPKKKAPSREDLQGLDALVFDIQEIGVRYYTYASTMVYGMKAAAEAGIPYYVLDRPNMAAPLGVYGPILEKEFHGGFTSFYPIPIAHGMTMGELAQFYNAEFGIGANLTVIRMQGYDRSKFYDELGFPWRNPSPNIRSMNAVIGYHCLGMLEDMTWSVGRGTSEPFVTYGLSLPQKGMQDGMKNAQTLDAQNLPGLQFNFSMFSPESSKLQKQTCMGFNLNVKNRRIVNPFRTMLVVLREVAKLFPDSARNKEIDRTARSVGSRKLLAMVKAGKSVEEIEQAFRKEASDFAEKTAKYHIYTNDPSKQAPMPSSPDVWSGNDYAVLPPYERLQSAVKKVVDASIQDGAFPSASVGVLHNGKVVMRESFGRFTYTPNSLKTPLDAAYDMASLTKVMATTLSIMKLYDEGKIGLEDSVTKYVPEFGANGKSHVRVKNLLLHNSGLAAFRPYDLRVKGSEEAMKMLYAEKLVYTTGDSTVYSDLGFITLGEIIRRISGKPLDAFYADNIARPLGLLSSGFNPDSLMRLRTAPTENDTTWKQDFKRPLVHDPRAALLHGVAGHAGLFSNVDDILRVMQVLTAPESNLIGGKPFIKPETFKLFTTRAGEKYTRALGWDTKAAEKCSCGDFFAPTSFGHTGFTGTSIWYDPVRKLCVVLLSNRVFPTSENNKIRAVRPQVHNAVVQALESR